MIREVLDSITYKRLSEFYSLVMGGSINEKDEFGYGILHSAISSEFDEAAIYYIEHGGDVNAQDNNGATALHYCAAYKNKIIAKRLAEVGASFEIADRHGNEPLWTALNACTSTDISIFELYLNYTDRINIKNNYELSPLDLAQNMNDQELINLMKNGNNK